ncbi:hypothetical protein L1987_50911 [Smallanthus sonchifolius]|uniref:Uncharacterized protein n=1 Tax=Smallanthus sonchifolius TaxID=185202 RepID=A0ACB9EP67_9ASTR|nr:hypothetical protein L1987_50911 [Smallanthus sonchifolius]
METNNQPPPPPPPPLRYSSSDSSLSAHLFGDNDSPHSSAGIFASILPPPSTMAGNSSCVDSQVWYTVHGTLAENVAKNTVNANSGVMNMERRSIFQERIEPCPLSSSIYYGGQEDMYVRSSTDLTSKSYTKFLIEKNSKDDPNHLQSATRGNWWQACQDRFTIEMSLPTSMISKWILHLLLKEIHGDL